MHKLIFLIPTLMAVNMTALQLEYSGYCNKAHWNNEPSTCMHKQQKCVKHENWPNCYTNSWNELLHGYSYFSSVNENR